MIGNKQDLENYLVFQDNDKQFFRDELPLSKEKRSIAQNSTFYRCFDLISKKMWVSKETIKQNILKALFWVEISKFGGVIYENAIKPHTSELNKEEAILLIESSIEFAKKLWMGEIVTSREVQSLFYNN